MGALQEGSTLQSMQSEFHQRNARINVDLVDDKVARARDPFQKLDGVELRALLRVKANVLGG